MAYGNNRLGKQPRSHFMLAGGTIMKFKHPYLAGQLGSGNSPIDEIDISACVKLDGRFFEATPSMDSSKQVVLVDGSVVTICNKMLNGTISLPVLETTGLVSSGDFIACLQMIKSVGDSVGGLLYRTKFIGGKAITRLYYGVTVKSVPDDILEGNDVAVYNVQLGYAGWIDAVSTTNAQNLKKIWAVGASNGLEGYFTAYAGQNADGLTGTKENPMSASELGITDTAVNDNTDKDTNIESYASGASAGSFNDIEKSENGAIVNIQTVSP